MKTIIEKLIRDSQERTSAIVTHRGVMHYALTNFFGLTEADAWTKTAAYGASVVVSSTPHPCEVLR